MIQAKKISSLLIIFIFISSINFTISVFPNFVWLYWDNGPSALGQMGKLCLQRITEKNKNWEIRLVSDNSLNSYLDQNQLTQLQRITKFQGVKLTSFSKSFLIRMMLLSRYGGVWIDTLLIPLQSFDWLNKLKSNTDVTNKLGTAEEFPQAFFFYEAFDPALGRLNIIQENQTTFYPTIQMDLTMLAATQNSVYIKDLFNQLKLLHQKGKDYYNKIKDELFLFKEFRQNQTLILANHIIQHRQYRQYEKNKKQKLPVSLNNFYKVWSINRMKGPHSYTKERNIQILFKDLRHFTYQPKYFIKLQAGKRDSHLNRFLTNDSFQKDMLMRQYNQYLYDFAQYYLPRSYSCLYKSYVDENSIMNQHFIQQFNPERPLQIQTIKVTQNRDIPWICKKTTIYNMYDNMKEIWEFLYIPLYLIIFIQLLIQITLSLKRYNIQLREENINEHIKEDVKERLFMIGLLFYVVYMQYLFLFQEIFMWYYESPYSIVLWIFNIGIMCFVLSYFNIVQRKILEIVINMDIFVGLVVTQLFIQQLFVKYFSVWNYNGFLFHFQKLSRMNVENNNQIIWGFWKILVMLLIAKIYFGSKKYYNIKKEKIFSTINDYLDPVKKSIKEKLNPISLKINKIKKDFRIDQKTQEQVNMFAQAAQSERTQYEKNR